MPEICGFYGIIIRMYLIDKEHPPRHIHIRYGAYEAVMELKTGNENVLADHYPETRSALEL
jgi:hypothetical protein